MDIISYAMGKKSGNVSEASGSVNINQNGTHNVKFYATAVVDVPNSYDSSDNGKVVVDGALVSQSSQSITQAGTYDTTLINEVVVNPTSALGVSF